jgi:hypothetical protein
MVFGDRLGVPYWALFVPQSVAGSKNVTPNRLWSCGQHTGDLANRFAPAAALVFNGFAGNAEIPVSTIFRFAKICKST